MTGGGPRTRGRGEQNAQAPDRPGVIEDAPESAFGSATRSRAEEG